MLTLAAVDAAAGARPFLALFVSVGLLVALIGMARLHAFIALLIAAVVAGAISGSLPGADASGMLIASVELTAREFGVVCGKIAVPIAMAAIIGMALSESGAAEKVVRRFLAAFGEHRAGPAILVASYVLSIPIFFDTYLLLLLPLVQGLARRTGKDYILYLMAVCCAGSVTHCSAVPHPGPLAMAEQLHMDPGATLLPALLVGVIPVTASWFTARWINRRLHVPPPNIVGATTEIVRPESELPPLWLSLLPVIGPLFLLGAASTIEAVPSWSRAAPDLCAIIRTLGNRHVALFLGAACSIAILLRQRRVGLAAVSELLAKPLEAAGVIILITSAGGAFGLMLGHAGIGQAVQDFARGREIDLIILGWSVAAVIRAAQGSTTVAVLSTAGIIAPLLQGHTAYHPVYVFLAISFGGLILSWMNDSGFWVVSRLGGLNESQTLRSWTVVVTVNSVAGLVACVVLSRILPFA